MDLQARLLRRRGETAAAEAVRGPCVFQYSQSIRIVVIKAVTIASQWPTAHLHATLARPQDCSRWFQSSTMFSHVRRDVERLVVLLGGPSAVITKVRNNGGSRVLLIIRALSML
jgi:hypothetical protein